MTPKKYSKILGSVILVQLLWLSACANNDNVQNGDELASQADASANTEAPPADSELGSLSESAPMTDESAVDPNQASNTNSTDAELNAVLNESQPPSSETPPMADAGSAENSESLTPPPPTEGETFSSNESLSPDAATPPPTEPTLDANAAALTVPTEPEASPEPTLNPPSAPIERAAYSGAKVPKIPKNAVRRAGTKLNRFYFVRKGDTPKNVSELLYGSTSQSKSLKKWNAGQWKPGKLLFYQSASDPQDSEMKSFYAERNIPAEEVMTRRGDWLSRIAKKTLGHPGSWKEIAVLNGLPSADSITPGEKLTIYPNLHGGTEPAVAQNTEPINMKAPEPAPIIPPPPVTPPPVDLANQQAPLTPPPVENPIPVEAVKKRQKGGLNIARIIEQNFFFILVGGGITVLLLALLALNRRKQGRGGEDFGDENFAAAKKRR